MIVNDEKKFFSLKVVLLKVFVEKPFFEKICFLHQLLLYAKSQVELLLSNGKT